MAETYAKLRKLSKDELIVRYDRVAAHTVDSQLFLREEIARRDAEEQSAEMARLNQEVYRLTKQMRDLTLFIAVLTIANVVFVIATLIVTLAPR